MAKIVFTVPAVAALYETDFETDPVYSIGCECNNGQGYSGRLSNTPIGAADELVRQKSNMIRLKKQNGASNQQSAISEE